MSLHGIERRLERVWFTRRTAKATKGSAGCVTLTGHLGDKRIAKIIPKLTMTRSLMCPEAVIECEEDAIRREFEAYLRSGIVP